MEESEDERFEDVSDPAPPIELPVPDVSRLEDLHELVVSCLAVPLRREKLSLALEQEGYLRKIIEVFRTAESSNDRTALNHLYHIFRSIFLLNKNAIFEILFAGKLIQDLPISDN